MRKRLERQSGRHAAVPAASVVPASGRFMMLGTRQPGSIAGAEVTGELPLVEVQSTADALTALLPPALADIRDAVVVPAFRKQGDRERLIDRDSGAFRTAVNILKKWGLNREHCAALVGVPVRTFYAWAAAVAEGGRLREPLPPTVLERVSYVLGIWKASLILLPSEAAAIKFMQTPNTAPAFRGRPPLERMLSGQTVDLAATRQWLDGWRGG